MARRSWYSRYLWLSITWWSVGLFVWVSFTLSEMLGGHHWSGKPMPSTVIVFGCWGLVAPLLARLAECYPIARPHALRNFVLFLAGYLAVGAITVIVGNIPNVGLDLYPLWYALISGDRGMIRTGLIYFTQFGATLAAILAFQSIERARESERASASLEEELLRAEVSQISSQLPASYLKSLFEWLNESIDREPALAERHLTLVAEFFRALLDSVGAREWTVARDVALAESWLSIECARRGVPIALHRDLRGAASDDALPAAALYPALLLRFPDPSLMTGVDSLTVSARDGMMSGSLAIRGSALESLGSWPLASRGEERAS